MRFIIDINKEKIINYLESNFRELVRFLYQWISTDGEVLGYILGIWHLLVCINIFICVLLCHTIYPNFWFQFAVFACMFTIWIQHIFLHVCVVFVAEVNLTNKEPPFYTIIRDITSLNMNDFISHFLVAETIALGCFFLEILGKISLYIHEYYGVKL
uniref:Uncharacterized protein n=1 Tax=viral metagenome TaxID=1070528 RepID=A0A6C0EPB2_9ZZZZ